MIIEDTFPMQPEMPHTALPPQGGRTFSFSVPLQPTDSLGPRASSMSHLLQAVDPSEMPEVRQSISAAIHGHPATVITTAAETVPSDTMPTSSGHQSAAGQHGGTRRGGSVMDEAPHLFPQMPDLHVPVPPGDPSHELYCATRLPLPTDPEAFTFTETVDDTGASTGASDVHQKSSGKPAGKRYRNILPAALSTAMPPAPEQARTVIDLTAQKTPESTWEEPMSHTATTTVPPAAPRTADQTNPLATTIAQNFTYPRTNPNRSMPRAPPPPSAQPTNQPQPSSSTIPPAGIPLYSLSRAPSTSDPSTPSGYRFVAGHGFVCQVCGTAVRRPQRHVFMGRWCEGNRAQMAEEMRRVEEGWEVEKARRRRVRGLKVVW